MLMHDDDALLWIKFKNGDRDAFTLLYKKHIIPLIAYGSKLCSDRDQLRDQIQELFVELWNSREYLTETDSVKFYLFRALRYKLVRLAKSLHRQADIVRMNIYEERPYMENSIETSIVEKEVQVYNTALLKEAVSHLTVRQQEIIQLRFYQGFSHDQIAELMQMNYQSVSNLLYRALGSLKERMSIPALVSFILFLLSSR